MKLTIIPTTLIRLGPLSTSLPFPSSSPSFAIPQRSPMLLVQIMLLCRSTFAFYVYHVAVEVYVSDKLLSIRDVYTENEFAVVRLAIQDASFDRPAKSWTGSGIGQERVVSLILLDSECQADHIILL